MQQNSLFKSVNCSTCFGWYFTHHQELISTVSGINVTCTATYRERGWTGTLPATWLGEYHPKYVEQLKDLNKLYSIASYWIIIDIFMNLVTFDLS